MKPDWEKYRETFPARYIKFGNFDNFLRNNWPLIRSAKRVLDIGGGKGTDILYRGHSSPKLPKKGPIVYLLDPYVKAPKWMAGNVNLQTNLHFDVGIARGSINYLSPREIKKLTFLCTCIFANSFRYPPPIKWTSRAAKTADGRPLIERVRLKVCKRPKVEHELITETGKKIIHRFYYYSIDDFKQMLPGVEIRECLKTLFLTWKTK